MSRLLAMLPLALLAIGTRRPLAAMALVVALASGAARAQQPPRYQPPGHPRSIRQQRRLPGHPNGSLATGTAGASQQPVSAPTASAPPSGAQPAGLQRTTAAEGSPQGALLVPAHTSTNAELLQDSPAAAPGLVRQVPSLTPLPQQPLLQSQLAHVRITIRTIRAQRGQGGLEIDDRLRRIDRDLHSFAEQFNYRSYQLLDEQSFDLDTRSAAQVELPGGRALEVEPRLVAPSCVKVHMELLGQHPEHLRRMSTDYSIPYGRTILVLGYRVDATRPEQGTLLIALTQER